MKNLAPVSAGFYWARGRSAKWFNLIVEAYGDAPFLRLRAWDRMNNVLKSIESWDIEEWGPRIDNPDNIPTGK